MYPPVYEYPAKSQSKCRPIIPFLHAGEVLPVNERQILFANGSLLIRRVVRNDAGDYSCRAENDEGMSAVGTLTLSVAGK